MQNVYNSKHNHDDGRGTEGEEEGNKCNPEPVLSLTKAHTTYEMVRTFFYMHTTGKHEQNISSFELMLFHLKCKISNKQLSITAIFGKKRFAHWY
jgi:hypothetical protein